MSDTYIDKLAWIHIKDGRLLTARSKGKDTYYIPGGKRESGESDSEALIREIEEELTVSLVPKSLAPLGQFEAQAHGKPEGTLVRMTCYTGAYTGDICASSEIEELAWLKHSERHKTSVVDVIIMDWLKAKAMIE